MQNFQNYLTILKLMHAIAKQTFKQIFYIHGQGEHGHKAFTSPYTSSSTAKKSPKNLFLESNFTLHFGHFCALSCP